MEEWIPYVSDIVLMGLHKIIVFRLDGEKWIVTAGCKYDKEEATDLYNMVRKSSTMKTVMIQGLKYRVTNREDFYVEAKTDKRDLENQEVACISKSRQFIVCGMAMKVDDQGQCTQEMLRLTQHIREQGL